MKRFRDMETAESKENTDGRRFARIRFSPCWAQYFNFISNSMS